MSLLSQVSDVFNSLVDQSLSNSPILQRQFVQSSKAVLSEARERYGQEPFRLLTDWGELLILPPRFADEIRNDNRLSFAKAATGLRFVHRRDSRAAIQRNLVCGETEFRRLDRSVASHPSHSRSSLTKSTPSTEWNEISIKSAISDVVARISSRIQLGEELCRNEEWLRITKTYTTTFYTATTKLRAFPWAIRLLVHWFQPECQKLRFELESARRIIQPLVDQRRKMRQEAVASGKPPPQFDDAIDWADKQAASAGSSFDPVVFQLTLSLLSIHTTYDLLQQTMIELARTPHIVEEIRREVVEILRAEGWKKTSLAKMKLLDSAIKEAQRLKPGSIGMDGLLSLCTAVWPTDSRSVDLVTMRRYVERDMTLSNGLLLKKGTRLNIDNSRMTDEEIYPDPKVYNPYRFLEMRERAGYEHIAHLVSTSSTHLGFGHGQHACPGRFFAANEIKVALCHMLIKYDWTLAPGTEVEPDTRGMVSKSSPETTMLVRRRVHTGLDLDGVEAE
ncbi:hypothetical protein F66182_3358 [Fusarium sp. NRRL 66182]|nr:hypothetical protein F66182_3358 [Fusarium sp. NRRL 66182]